MSEVELLGVRYIAKNHLKKVTGCSVPALRQAERAGLLRKIKFGRDVYYPEPAVRRWVESKLSKAEPAGERVTA